MCAEIAQLGERQTEDLKVPGSIPGFGKLFFSFPYLSATAIEIDEMFNRQIKERFKKLL